MMQRRTAEADEVRSAEDAGRDGQNGTVPPSPPCNFGLRTAGERVWCLARDGALADRPEVRREGLESR